MKKRFPKQAASMVGLARPYASKEGLEDTLDVAVAVFGLLGCVDDAGSQQKAPYSVRAVWKKCIEAWSSSSGSLSHLPPFNPLQ